METLRKIELLAPARDLMTGRVAVDCGADAVYIGGPGFGARHAAGNSAEDVAELVRYAHPFGVRVYATLNTVLSDEELDEAREVARLLIDAGVDALIVQDMGWLRMGLADGSGASGGSGVFGVSGGSGVEFHASTQVSNMLPEDVAFLGRAGFRRVILERALSLNEIAAIHAFAPEVELEVFVHGAVCVGYSGRCFFSRATSGRSGNRGDCSQPCRLAYDLAGKDGEVLMRGKHLLSVCDLDLSARIGELLDAGVSSFKIEGRLKDAGYVRNIVSHYRRVLDRELAVRAECGEGSGRAKLERASAGRSVPDFEPAPSKSFTRGAGNVGGAAGAVGSASAGEYFFDGAVRGVASWDTPKAIGEFLGFCDKRTPASDKTGFFTLDGEFGKTGGLSAGDGICFFAGGELRGTNIVRVEGGRIYPNRMDGIVPGTEVFRNYDHAFVRSLERSRMKRRIAVEVQVSVGRSEVSAVFTDETGVSVSVVRQGTFDEARDGAKMEAVIRDELSRSGYTMFEVGKVEICGTGSGASSETGSGAIGFVPVSVLAGMRREGLERLLQVRQGLVAERRPAVEDMSARFPRERVEACENVTNCLAEQFYRDHGVVEIAPPLENRPSLAGEVVMRTRYCIRREMGECLRSSNEVRVLPRELYLVRGKKRFGLEFDCDACEMKIIAE